MWGQISVILIFGAAFFGMAIYAMKNDHKVMGLLSLIFAIPIASVIIWGDNIFVQDKPADSLIKFSTIIENQRIYFDDYIEGYQVDNINVDVYHKNVYIPKHYYLERGWLDKYVLCTEPMLIVIPHGTTLQINGSIAPTPFIYQGAVECK